MDASLLSLVDPLVAPAYARVVKRRLAERLREPAGTVFVPGHGAPGGREIVEASLAWFGAAEEEVLRAASEGVAPERAVERLRKRFPGFLPGGVLRTAVSVIGAPR